jgi:hypothetical protein
MSAAISGIMIGRSKIVIAAQGCMKCGVEFSEGWTEKKVQIVVAGRRHEIGVPICAGCAPHCPTSTLQHFSASTSFPPVEVGHL